MELFIFLNLFIKKFTLLILSIKTSYVLNRKMIYKCVSDTKFLCRVDDRSVLRDDARWLLKPEVSR